MKIERVVPRLVVRVGDDGRAGDKETQTVAKKRTPALRVGLRPVVHAGDDGEEEEKQKDSEKEDRGRDCGPASCRARKRTSSI